MSSVAPRPGPRGAGADRALRAALRAPFSPQARRELLEWVEAGSLRLLIHEVLPLASAAAAHRCLEERRNVGKVLLRA